MNFSFKELVDESIIIPTSYKTVSRQRKPTRINLSPKFLECLSEEFQNQLKSYTDEDGRQDVRRCKNDFLKTLSMAQF